MPHPGFRELDDHVLNIFCYVLRHPGEPGPSLVIRRNGEDVYAQLGDWSGAPLEPHDEGHALHRQVVSLLETTFPRLVALMRSAGLPQAEFYFAGDLVLTDVRLSLNKFVGPGMLKDVFGKLVATPDVLKIEVVDDRVMQAVLQGGGSYSGDLLLKPSKFREIELPDGTYAPLYAQVRR